MSEPILSANAPWNQDWPPGDLERVPVCPICGSTERSILHEHLVDNVFFVAPGKWSMQGCASCGGAYLDPRPSKASIHRAYASYYTHQVTAAKDTYANLSPWRKLRRRLVNGYTNWRYSTQAQPASRMGVWVAHALPGFKKVLDREYRNLPRLPRGGGTLLDVGCGDGSFLALARTCGWAVTGLDPDPKAVANAARRGLTVHEGGIEVFAGQTALFDVITLNHVIEHVYEPDQVLAACHALLKPGGQLWLETPNIDSLGHWWFGQNWRGLETPRHLVLFNRSSLHQACVKAGFVGVRDRIRLSHCADIFKASFAMRLGQSPYAALNTPKTLKFVSKLAAFAEAVFPSHREFLTVSARKAAR